MRIRITLTHQDFDCDRDMIIPLDYRRHLISMVKSITDRTPLFRRFMENKPGYSPYVFAAHFAQIDSIESSKMKMVIKPPVVVTISTGMFDVMTAICNGVIKMKGRETVLGLAVKDVQLLPDRRIQSRNVAYKMAGHAVLRGRDTYLNGSISSEVEEAINTHLSAKMRFLNEHYGREILPGEQCPVQVISSSGIKKGVCFHYGGTLTTLRGNIVLAGEPLALQFLYDFGMGVRNGQGFGLMEVMSEA